MSCNVVVPKRVIAAFVAVAFLVCLSGAYAFGQATVQPKNEIFAGYSWLHPNGYVDWGKVSDIVAGGDISFTHYLPNARNLGIIADGSFHDNSGGSRIPTNGNIGSEVGILMGGLQYKWHNDQFSPFVRALVGADHLSPQALPSQWKPAVGGGGGFDLSLTKALAIRLAQIDYIYTNYSPRTFTGHSSQWNMIRLAAGIEYNLGYYPTAPLTAACTAQPTEVMEGEPVKVTATGSNFNPKHTVTYGWTTNGGKLSANNAQTATIDTTGMAAGSYSANATITDPKEKKNNSATCAANFTVKAKPMNPPQVSCSVNPSTVQAGSPVTVTSSVTSPDGAQITSVAYQASAGRVSGSGNTATHDTTGVPAGPVTITVTATDARNLTGTGNCSFTVEAPPAPPQVTTISSCQFPDAKRPWRVDNTCKAILDDVASRLKADPNARVSTVGYADGEKAPMEGKGKNRQAMDLAAQRAVNAKAYLVQQQGIDPSRIDVRKGTGKSQTVDYDWIPQGADAASAPILQGTTPVDESVVKPSTNAYPMPHTAAPKHKAKKAAATPAQ
jgi:outer membrane protein OmpA-like peptidoglycan-associated protein